MADIMSTESIDMQNQSGNSQWRQAMYYVLFGLMLSTVTFHVLGLNYVLPIIGLVLQWIGFARLQKDMIWFEVCLWCTRIRIIIFMFYAILNATIYSNTAQQSTTCWAMNMIDLLCIVVIIICFWLGMRGICSKLAKPIHNQAAGWLVVWYLCMVILAVLQYSGLFGLVMLILYFIIFYKLFKFSAQIDEAEYQVQTVQNSKAEKKFAVFVSVVLIAGIGAGYLCFNQYPMNWNAVSEEAQLAQSENEVYRHLKALGVDEAVLQDLSAEDLALCKDAIRVYVEKESTLLSLKYEYAQNMLTLNFTHIAIELPSENDNALLRIIHHFQWSEPLDYYGTEGLKLWPTYVDHNNRLTWGKASEMTGQVLYTADGQVYCAPYYTLDAERYQSANFFTGVETKEAVFAEFSFPKGGDCYRGYVTYATEQKDAFVDSWICYEHQRDWTQYPVKTAVDYLKTGSYSSNAFWYCQKALQEYMCIGETDV